MSVALLEVWNDVVVVIQDDVPVDEHRDRGLARDRTDFIPAPMVARNVDVAVIEEQVRQLLADACAVWTPFGLVEHDVRGLSHDFTRNGQGRVEGCDPMITFAEPPSHRSRALAISVVLHASVLALLAALLPAWHAMARGYGFLDSAACARPCEVVTIRLLAQVRALARAPSPHAVWAAQGRSLAPAGPIESVGRALVVAAAPRKGSLTATAFSLSPPRDIVAVATVQPSVAGLFENVTIRPREILAPGNWGSHFETPALRDRALYDELVALLPKGGSVTILVDEHGHASDVRIVAPGLDPAMLASLRQRLLAARYAPVERDGVAFDGTLQIRAR